MRCFSTRSALGPRSACCNPTPPRTLGLCSPRRGSPHAGADAWGLSPDRQTACVVLCVQVQVALTLPALLTGTRACWRQWCLLDVWWVGWGARGGWLGAVCPVGLPGGGRARVESGTAIPSRPERSLAQARTPDPPTRWGPTAVSPPARVAERRPRGGACLCSSGCPRAPGLQGGRDADFQVVRVAAVNGTRRLRDALACSQMGVAAQGVVGLIETSRHPMSPNVTPASVNTTH